MWYLQLADIISVEQTVIFLHNLTKLLLFFYLPITPSILLFCLAELAEVISVRSDG